MVLTSVLMVMVARLDTFAKLKNSVLSSRESVQFMPQLSDKIDTRSVM